MNIVINPQYEFLREFIESVPTDFHNSGETIYKGRNILKSFECNGVNIVIKSFKTPIYINRIAYTFFRRSKAKRSFDYSFEILKRGLDVPAPIAYIEQVSGGLLDKSYYISVYHPEAFTMRQHMAGEIEDDGFLNELVEEIDKMHSAGLMHSDLSPGNILCSKINDKNHFFIIDINRMAFLNPLSDKLAAKDLSRLALSYDVSSRIASYYAELRNTDKEEFVDLVNKYSDEFFLAKTKKNAFKQMKKEMGMKKAFCGPLREYHYIRYKRIHSTSEEDKTILFKKEKTLYNKYYRQWDIRKVLIRKYGYDDQAIDC